jgi:hypothetical protein
MLNISLYLESLEKEKEQESFDDEDTEETQPSEDHRH